MEPCTQHAGGRVAAQTEWGKLVFALALAPQTSGNKARFNGLFPKTLDTKDGVWVKFQSWPFT